MKQIIATALILAVFAVSPASSQSSGQLAEHLGALLGAEGPCSLSYDQAAIEQFIDERVSASDMEFNQLLRGQVMMTELGIARLSESALTAYCAQTRRVARSFNFITE